nr:SPOR domain-containing protein [Gilliamella sp. W8145]
MDDSKWLLQCGAFKEKTNADTLKASLAMTGISGNITTSQQLYRVTVGPYTNKTDAQKVLNTLKTNGINNCIISN